MTALFARFCSDWRWPAALLAIVFISLIASLPLGSALQFGADEGMELSKALIYTQDADLKMRLWNDQPALFTEILSAAFQLVSPTILVARWVAIAFALLMCVSIWGVTSELSSKMAGVLAVLFFLLSPRVPPLLVSPMIELPAFALALASFWVCLVAYRKGSYLLLGCSALLYGCALNVKLTAALMLPAVFLHLGASSFKIAAENPGSHPSKGSNGQVPFGRSTLQPLLMWLGFAAAAAFLLLWTIPPGVHWALLWSSHARASVNNVFKTDPFYAFDAAQAFRAHPEAVLGAIVGYFFLMRARQWRAAIFPAVFVVTALAVHNFHRPWWSYYYLHFVIPLAILSGIGIHSLTKYVAETSKASASRGAGALVAATVLSFLVATLLVGAIPRFATEYAKLRLSPVIKSSYLLTQILRYKSETPWFYSLDAKYSFLSLIPSPPEIAVLPVKRFYSGGISFEGILEYLRKYEPGQVLVTSDRERGPEWTAFLNRAYFRACENNGSTLYVKKPAGPKTPLKPNPPALAPK